MAKKNGKPKSRAKRKLKSNPCGCFYCCGHTNAEIQKLKQKYLELNFQTLTKEEVENSRSSAYNYAM